MSLMKRLAVLGAAAEAARRYAKQNPDKAREFTNKAAQFVDHQTKGKYSHHIDKAKGALASAGGFADTPVPGPAGGPIPAHAEVVDPVTGPRPTPYRRS